MGNSYKLSIIVPLFNAGSNIEKCIIQLVQQNYQDIEILLIDDGSTDNSQLICERLIKDNDNIKYYKKANGGVSSARNLGIKKSKGDYIGFVDVDDVIDNNMFFLLMKDFMDDSSIDVTVGNYITINVSKKEKAVKRSEKVIVNNEIAIEECLASNKKRIGGYYTSVWNKVFKASIIKNNHLYFDETLQCGEDEKWLVTVLRFCNKVSFNSLPIYYYDKRNQTSLSNSRAIEKSIDSIRARRNTYEIVANSIYNKRLKNLVGLRLFIGSYCLLKDYYSVIDYKTKSWNNENMKLGFKGFLLSNNISGFRKITILIELLYYRYKPQAGHIHDYK